MIRLGVNVYCWEEARQNRLLAECLAPAVFELQEEIGPVLFWFDRFDARGPHVFAVLSLADEACRLAESALASRLRTFFASHPSGGTVPLEQVQRRHEASRHLALCELDRAPGIEPEDACRFFLQPPDAFPFHLVRQRPEEDQQKIWEIAHQLSLWSTQQIAVHPERRPLRAAVSWLAAFFWLLLRTHPRAEAYWRYHAASLLRSLPQRLESDEQGVLDALPGAIGERNIQAFSSVWSQMQTSEPPWPAMSELVHRLCSPDLHGDSWRPPREIVHSLLKQLCVPVAHEIPLILYAWHRASLEKRSR
jgi:hypothetical protein